MTDIESDLSIPESIIGGSIKWRYGCATLTKELIRRGSFKSKEDLQGQLETFIEYFNQTMAKPLKWTLKGFPFRI